MRRTLEDWRSLLAEQAASGKSVAAFCREKGLNDNRFYMCRKQLQGQREKYARLKPVGTAPITIELEGGLKLQVAVEQLQAVLDVLRN